MQIPTNISPEDLLRYAQDEIDRKAAAERAERQAIRDRMLEKIEANRAANVKADLEREARECPSARTAQFLFDTLGDRWPEFVRMLRASTYAKFVPAVNHIESEREALSRHRGVEVAATVREDAKAAAMEARRSRVEAELAAVGVRVDWTSDDAAAA